MLLDFTASPRNRIRSHKAFPNLAIAYEIEFWNPEDERETVRGIVTALLDADNQPTWNPLRAVRMAGVVIEGPEAGLTFVEDLTPDEKREFPLPN